MKIAVDARGALWFRGTGIGTYTYQLIKGLAASGSNEFLFFSPEESPLAEQIQSTDINWVAVADHPTWQVEQAHMVQSMVANQVDLYHMPQNGLNLPKQVPFPVVVTLHDVIPYILPQTCNPAFRRRFLTQMPYIARRSDGLITVSHYSKQDILKHLGIPPEKITVIYAAPEPIYVPLPKEPCMEFLEQHYGIKGDPLVLYVGGFSMRKNVGLLLRAFGASLGELGPRARLILTGRPTPEVTVLKELAAWLNITEEVVYTGHVPVEHLPQFYGAANVFAYPSLYEGFGMPPLEAMACGTPTIVSHAGALPEVVGNGAWQIDPYDAKEFAKAIIEVILNPKTATGLSQKGREWVKRYSWSKVVKETILTYQKILDG
ncbi:MAG: glycosyltransferase family 4 protein [Firmicutes bacterium]|nr:glycosyltransferase family 4 protein [Bacillota bacterium]